MMEPVLTRLSMGTASSTVRIKAMNGSVVPARISSDTTWSVTDKMIAMTTQTRPWTLAVTTTIFTTRPAVGPGAGRTSLNAEVNVLERRRRNSIGGA